jgi:hypothetical protein
MRIKISAAIFFLLSSFLLKAQPKLSASDLAEFKGSAEERIELFQDYVKNFFSKKGDNQQRSIWRKQAINLFDLDAKIEVSNKNGKKKKYTIPQYFDVISTRSSRYDFTVVHFLSTKVSNFRPVKKGNGEIYYVGSYTFIQRFCAKKSSENEKWDYCDHTEKKGEITLDKEELSTGKQWVVKLGDIVVTDTYD